MREAFAVKGLRGYGLKFTINDEKILQKSGKEIHWVPLMKETVL